MPPPESTRQEQPPPKRPSRGPVVAIVLVAVAILGVAAIGLSRLGGTKPAADPGATPTATWLPDRGTTISPSTSTHRSTVPSPTTSPRTSTTPPPPTTTSTEPVGPQPVAKLGDNPLFEVAGLPATTCELARWSTDPAGAELFFRSALPCLDAAWAPVMKAANLPFAPPHIAFPIGNTGNSACGSAATDGGRVAAFYCPTDRTIYLPFAALQTDMYGAHPGVYLAVLAHEYGHHIQNLGGIETAYTKAANSARSDDERQEWSRRLELEAQCFSGMFLNATTGHGDVDGDITHEAQTTQDRGDHNGPPRDHGTDEHAQSWWNQGFQHNSLARCDTWLASSADVA